MNQQWLTTLLSKGIEIEQQLRQQLSSTKKSIKDKLEERGIRLSATDLAALIEEVSPKASNVALSYALDIVRPFSAGMGLRVSRLSDSNIEMVIPARTRNMNEENIMHEGALAGASVEAAKILWLRHAPLGDFKMNALKINMNIHKVCSGDCRIRMELPENLKENVLAQLRNSREGQAEVLLNIFDGDDQSVGDIVIDFHFLYTPSLGTSTQSKE